MAQERDTLVEETIILAGRMEIPAKTQAILWDMDGVLIDSLGLDLVVVNDLLRKHFGEPVSLSREYVQSIFAYHIPEFWKMILEKVARDFNTPVVSEEGRYEKILQEYNDVRQNYPFNLCPGISEILGGAKRLSLAQAVVSNNPTEDVKEILANVGILDKFNCIVGNDLSDEQKQLAKKPAPDTYLFAAKQIGIDPTFCVAVEDSDIGVQAGKAAGCFTVGVATGAATEQELRKLNDKVDRVYNSFAL